MVQTLIPRVFRGFSWVWVSVTLLAIAPSFAEAQTGAGKADSKKAEATAKKGAGAPEGAEDIAKNPEGQGVVDTNQMKKQETIELFKDPRSEKANINKFEEFPYPPGRSLSTSDLNSLKNMAAGLSGPDPALIARAVDIQVAEMTNRTNIKYVIDPPKVQPGAAAFRAIDRASQFLMDLLLSAKEKKNDGFLSIYTRILFAKLTPLLNNHLLARMEASIILAEAATPSTIDTFTKQLTDPNQSVWVKLWSARGLTNATNHGRVVLDAVKATSAAASLVGFLDKEPEAPWPVKIRILEALGSIRMASTAGPQGKNPDVLATAVRILADTEERMEVRGWAAWTLGMIPVSNSMTGYNFSLEGYEIGRLVAEIGDQIGYEYDQHEASFAKQSDYARFLAGLLVYQVCPALTGDPDVPNTGLLNMRHPSISSAQPFLRSLDEHLKNIGRESIELLRSAGTEMKNARKTLGTRVTELNAFLDKNRPADTSLYPGGPKFDLTSEDELAVDPATPGPAAPGPAVARPAAPGPAAPGSAAPRPAAPGPAAPARAK